MIPFDTDPSRYRHWRLACEGPVATLTLDVAEEGALNPGYRLKLNSYDLGVDIELADTLNRIRFEHPEVRVAVPTSGDMHDASVLKRLRGCSYLASQLIGGRVVRPRRRNWPRLWDRRRPCTAPHRDKGTAGG